MRAWDAFLNYLEGKLGKEIVAQWLRPLRVSHFDSGNLYLEAEDEFQLTWFEEHIRPRLKKEFFNNNHRPIRIHIALPGNTPKATTSRREEPLLPPPLRIAPHPLNPLYTLDRFVTSKSNQLVLRVLQNLQELPKPAPVNPIYLYGETGSGKTHLLIGLALALQAQGLHPFYVHAETFTEHVVTAIRSSSMSAFRESYRKADCLLLDDVHLLARRAASQEELFHTFNALYEDRKPILISSHCPPPKLEEIEPRLISRFEWGITLHLQVDLAELPILAERMSQALHLSLSQESKEWLVATFAHPSTLWRALEALTLRTHLHNFTRELTLAQVQHYLSDLASQEKKKEIDPERIISAVCAFYAISKQSLLSQSHAQEHAIPRHMAIYLFRHKLRLSFPKIGRLFFRDHSTIMSSVGQVERKLHAGEEKTQEALRAIEEILKS